MQKTVVVGLYFFRL